MQPSTILLSRTKQNHPMMQETILHQQEDSQDHHSLFGSNPYHIAEVSMLLVGHCIARPDPSHREGGARIPRLTPGYFN